MQTHTALANTKVTSQRSSNKDTLQLKADAQVTGAWKLDTGTMVANYRPSFACSVEEETGTKEEQLAGKAEHLAEKRKHRKVLKYREPPPSEETRWSV